MRNDKWENYTRWKVKDKYSKTAQKHIEKRSVPVLLWKNALTVKKCWGTRPFLLFLRYETSSLKPRSFWKLWWQKRKQTYHLSSSFKIAPAHQQHWNRLFSHNVYISKERKETWTYHFVEVSGHNLESSQAWIFCMDFLNQREGGFSIRFTCFLLYSILYTVQ